MPRKAVEQTGLIPRSIIRTFDRFRKQLFPGAEKSLIQEFRISRYQFLVSIKCLGSLLFIPLTVNYLLKNFVLIPITENVWNTYQSEIFLNSYQQNRAFEELKQFQERLYFDYLVQDKTDLIEMPRQNNLVAKISVSDESNVSIKELHKNLLKRKPNFHSNQITLFNEFIPHKEHKEDFRKPSYLNRTENERKNSHLFFNKEDIFAFHQKKTNQTFLSEDQLEIFNSTKVNFSSSEIVQHKIQQKTLELALYYNHQSILAITNLIGDFITFVVISLIVVYMKPQILILKSFLIESIYSLNDTKKSFLLILGTDLLVGFHSPRGWEICLELFLRYFGFPENKDFVFLFVASFPVLLDTVFKYWIFRYLNKISPSTVATYHSMIE